MNPQGSGQASAYTGTRASYVALSAISILALALLCSIWTSEVSGSVAVLGLMAIYLASQELLVLFMVFAPASIIVDMIRLSGVAKDTHGRGWLVFLQLLGMAAKVAGAAFAWSLHKSVATGESSSYPSYAAPPPGPAMGSMYQRVEDPFQTAYAPPRHDAAAAPASMSSSSHGQQQQQQQQQQQSVPRSPPAPAQPAAPHHELV